VHSDDITKAIRGQVYVSIYQEPFRRASHAMRIQGDAAGVQKAATAEVATLDREMPVFIACVILAWRAMRLDPLVVLRYEITRHSARTARPCYAETRRTHMRSVAGLPKWTRAARCAMDTAMVWSYSR
jgi:hypothetical protein